MKRMTPCRLLALVVCGLAALPAHADDPPLRVGLVLSGGGARGTAHVGVLKVLEELRVPVHCIAGTSMGAVVGGMYAAGMSPQEMEEFLVYANWRDLLDDKPPRRELPYRRKQDDLTYLSELEVGFGGGRFKLPPGLVTGQKFGFVLQVETAHTVSLSSFDELPIPFRAVATDIETGEMVVLDRGDLGRAIRASMSVPGLFSPVEVGGRLLVDGGLVRNLPVDLVREMGADVVIAVDVGSPLRTREDLQSLFKVTSQVVAMMIRGNVEEQLPAADVVIHPQVNAYRATEFEKAGEMIPLGEAAASEQQQALLAYSVGEDAFRDFVTRIRRLPMGPSALESVQVTMSSNADPELVLRRVETRPGDPLDVGAIARDLRRLYQLGDYELVDFFLTEGEEGHVLHIEAHDKSWGPNYLRFGLSLNADFEGESSFNILADHTMTGLNALRGEAKMAVQIGEEPRLFGELYQPLHRKGVLFAAPWLELWRSSMTIYDDLRPLGEVNVELVRGGLDLGVQLGSYGEVRLGVTRGSGSSTRTLGSELPPRMDIDWGGYRLQVVLDQLDNPNFPRRGFFVDAGLFSAREDLGSSEAYERLEVAAIGARSRGRSTLAGMVYFGSALGSELPAYHQFQIGGLFSLSGYPFRSITGQYAGGVTAFYYRRLLRLPPALGDGLYIGASIEAGNAWEARRQVDIDDLRYATSIFIGADTVFGPLYVAYGRAGDGPDALQIFVGRSF